MQGAKKLHFSGLKLCFALMLGLLLVPAYVVVPILFKNMAAVDAGLIAGHIFHVANVAVLILTVAAALFCYRIQVAQTTWYLLGAVVLMVAANAFGVANMMAMIKAEVVDITILPKGDPMRMMFSFWHGLGSMMQLLASVCTVILVMQGQCPRPKATDEKQ